MIQGRVQGVGFRFFAQAEAHQLSLTGWVRNCSDGSVEAYAEGPRARVDAFVARLRQGPPLSRVDRISVTHTEAHNEFPDFSIR